jgi:ketosteroid isomerase-like protein
MGDQPPDPAAFVQHWIHAFNRRDWERYAACFADDATYLTPGRSEPMISRQAHVDHDKQNAGELQLKADLIVASDDGQHVAVEGLAVAPDRTSRWVTILEFRAGLIAAERLYFDRAS